tara:strand:+ start:766 stop:1140 length:375 start_codon:yes stop_codon:yes gene_type:complete
MIRAFLQLALVVWFIENLKTIFRALLPFLIIIFFFTPLYWLWDPKLSDIGYGIHLLVFYSILYLLAFLRAYFILKSSTTNYRNKKMIEAKKALSRNRDRLEALRDLEKYPNLERRKDKILKGNS